jgi:hypothetical protein
VTGELPSGSLKQEHLAEASSPHKKMISPPRLLEIWLEVGTYIL